jgi:hypothetical protein
LENRISNVKTMSSINQQLWSDIKAFELDNADAQLTFTERLARENNWSLEYACRAVEEYKKFMFLACISEFPLTPSEDVDQVWHLHLLYTESYWDDFCARVLKRRIHHGPTKGGSNEREKFLDWYSKTIKLYHEIFGTSPPCDLWPESKKRFTNKRFQRIDRDKFWIIPKYFKNK